jgi:hypothetical protein
MRTEEALEEAVHEFMVYVSSHDPKTRMELIRLVDNVAERAIQHGQVLGAEKGKKQPRSNMLE